MINIDDNIKEYRLEKDKRFNNYLDKIDTEQDFIRYNVKTSYGTIGIDIYKNDPNTKNAPVYFNFHGGGFVLGYYELDGPYCRHLATLAGCTVINIDYLLAPEHKFPLGINSSCEVVEWCLSHAVELDIDPSHIVLGGHSAGGNLAIGITRLLLDKGYTGLKGLLVDYAPCSQEISNIAYLDNIDVLSSNRNLQYISWYFNTIEELDNPFASPCNQTLTNFPRTLIISAENDPLREGEERFESSLRKHHIPVEYHCFKGCSHGFTHEYYKEYQKDKADEAWQLMGDYIKKCLK